MNKLIYILVLHFMACQGTAQVHLLKPNDFEAGLKQEQIQILDVRTMEEFNTMHLANSLQADWWNPTEFKSRMAHLDSSKAVYLYCQSGGRSQQAARFLAENGFEVYELQGGLSEWLRQNKAVVRITAVASIGLDSMLNLLDPEKLTLIDFGAKWCAPCLRMAPDIDSLEKQEGHRLKVIRIDGAVQTDLTKQLSVKGFPTLILYSKGVEVWRYQGYMTYNELILQLNL